jgi:hypothetical protein
VRFIDKLSRYPALDLESDFLTLVLAKRNGLRGGLALLPSINYFARQRALEDAIVRWTVDSEQERE